MKKRLPHSWSFTGAWWEAARRQPGFRREILGERAAERKASRMRAVARVGQHDSRNNSVSRGESIGNFREPPEADANQHRGNEG